MSGDKDSGDKTELPTPKKLRDARKKGDIAKSRELSSAVVTIGWLAVFVIGSGFLATRIADFTTTIVAAPASDDFPDRLAALATEATFLLVALTALVWVPIAALGTLTEFLQTRGLFSSEKLKPKPENLNPVEGFKRLFGKNGLVELLKTLAKAVAVCAVVWLVARDLMPDLEAFLAPAAAPVFRPGLGADAALPSLHASYRVTLHLLGAIAFVFLFVAGVDWLWTRHSFIKRMMMSHRDIRQETKQDEGDPHIRGHRRQLHQEWASSNAVATTGGATALLVNPTHIAIALDYDDENSPVPTIAAKGEGPTAAAMRAEATRAGVPIIRHVPHARTLWARGEPGEMIPEDMFDAIAEIILWARRARDGKAPMDCDLRDDMNRPGRHAAAALT